MTNKLQVVQWLNDHSLEELAADYGIMVKLQVNEPLVQFNYSQIYSDLSIPMCRECRGLILELGTLDVVSRGFDKFFNYSEPLGMQVPFNWNKFRTFNKIDGSLVHLYYYNGWKASTRGTIDASSNLTQFFTGIKSAATYSTVVFDLLFNEYNLSLSDLDRELTYVFELVSPFNRVIVNYEKTQLFFIGCRNNKTGEELDISTRIEVDMPTPEEYYLSDKESVIEFVESFPPDAMEGVILVDSNFNRLKVKSTAYLDTARTFSGLCSMKNRVEAVRAGKLDDSYGLIPEHIAKSLDAVKENIASLCTKVSNTYHMLNKIDSRKEFAECALEYSYSSWLFQLRDGKSIEEIVASSSIDLLLTLLEHIAEKD